MFPLPERVRCAPQTLRIIMSAPDADSVRARPDRNSHTALQANGSRPSACRERDGWFRGTIGGWRERITALFGCRGGRRSVVSFGSHHRHPRRVTDRSSALELIAHVVASLASRFPSLHFPTGSSPPMTRRRGLRDMTTGGRPAETPLRLTHSGHSTGLEAAVLAISHVAAAAGHRGPSTTGRPSRQMSSEIHIVRTSEGAKKSGGQAW